MTSNPHAVNVDRMREWIADLRTTSAAQCKGTLMKDYDGEARFCCLGRLVATQYGEPVHSVSGRAFPVKVLQFPGVAAKISTGALLDAATAYRLGGAEDDVITMPDRDESDDAYDVILATPGDEFWPDEDAVDLLPNAGEPRLTASMANDLLGWSFAQIADALEARYLPEDWAARETREEVAAE